MAITAALVCSPSSLSAATNVLGGGVKVNVACTVTNGDAVDVSVLTCRPFAGKNDPVQFGSPPIFPGTNVNVTAGGTLVLNWTVIFFVPQWAVVSGMPGTFPTATYVLGALLTTTSLVTLGDVAAATASFTITAPTAP